MLEKIQETQQPEEIKKGLRFSPKKIIIDYNDSIRNLWLLQI